MLNAGGTVRELLSEGTTALRTAGVDSPGLESEILLREALDATRVQLFDMLPYPVRPHAATAFRELIERRVNGEPIAYITGRRDFYEQTFVVNRHVLVPRPESECLVERALEWLRGHEPGPHRVVDIGTGSGAIAISIACASDNRHQVVASDLSRDALRVARQNRTALDANVHLVCGDLLGWYRGEADVVVANLPYLRPDQRHAGIEHEPEIALYAGDDGFDLNRRLLEQASVILQRPGLLVMEIDPDQRDVAIATAQRWFQNDSNEIVRDLAGVDRYLVIQRAS